MPTCSEHVHSLLSLGVSVWNWVSLLISSSSRREKLKPWFGQGQQWTVVRTNQTLPKPIFIFFLKKKKTYSVVIQVSMKDIDIFLNILIIDRL